MPRLLLAAIAAALTSLAFAASASADCPTENCGPGGGTTFPTPATTITSGPDATTGDNTPTFGFSSSLSFSRFECRWGPVNDPWSSAGAFACASPFTPAQQADGDYHLYVRACRDYEHPDTSEEIVKCDESPSHYGYLVDTKGPAVGWSISPDEGARFNVALTYYFTGATAYRCSVGTVVLGDCSSTFEITPQMLVGDGEKRVRVQGQDRWGNWGAVQERRFIWDTTGPAIALNAPQLTNDTTPALTFTATNDGSGANTFTCSIDDVVVGCGDGALSYAFELGDGTHTVKVVGKDPLGNPGTKEQPFVVDATKPVVSQLAWDAAAKRLSFSVDDPGATVTCQVDGGAFRACQSPFSPGTLAPGEHALTVRAIDAAGNPGQATLPVTIPKPPTENPGGDDKPGGDDRPAPPKPKPKPKPGGGTPPPLPVLAGPVPGPPAAVSGATPRRTTSTASPAKTKKRAACKTSKKKATKKKGKAKAKASATKKPTCTKAKKKKAKRTRKR